MNIKDMAFSVYSFFFNLGAGFGVKKNRVALVSMHNASFRDGLGEVLRVLEDEHKECEIIKLDRKEMFDKKTALKALTVDAFRLGRSRLIFLNDNFMPLAKTHPSKDTKIIQLWHGQGAFKKFGLSIEQPKKIRERERAANERLSCVVCSSKGVGGIYAEAFGVDEQRVITTGTPNEDYYFHPESLSSARTHVYERYPELKDKFVILYAPTFRDGAGDSEILNNFNAGEVKVAVDKWLDSLATADCRPSQGESDDTSKVGKSIVVTRLHPQVHGALSENSLKKDGCENGQKNETQSDKDMHNKKAEVNATDYESVNELCLVADLLITDYSSVCMDFALINKPTVFYAFDLDSYKDSRNFYFDYLSYVPGPVARDRDELLRILANGEFLSDESTEKLKKFKAFNFDVPDGNATKRLLSCLEL